MIDPIALEVLAAVPEVAERYLGLVEAADGDPGAAAALTELADLVAGLVSEMERHRPLLTRCLAAVEAAAAHGEDDLVVGAFIDSLSPDELVVLRPWLGRRTVALLEEVDAEDAGC